MSQAPPSISQQLLWSVALIALASVLGYLAFAYVDYTWNWRAAWNYRSQFGIGWLTTLGISACAMGVSLVTGLLLMGGRRSPWLPLRLFSTGVVQLLRGSPLLVQLLVGYYILAVSIRVTSPLLVGTLILGCFHGTYISEIFRGAVESIGASQREAARAVGFDGWQSSRYVILPQALRRALPGTTGQLVSLIKDSSLLSVIGIEELVQKVRILNSGSFTALEGYIPLAVAYLVMTLPLSWWTRRLERRFAYET